MRRYSALWALGDALAVSVGVAVGVGFALGAKDAAFVVRVTDWTGV